MASASDPITVLIADDDMRFRGVVAAALSDLDDVLVVGEASDGPQAVALTIELVPAVVLLDVRMPGGGGIGAVQSICRLRPATKIVMLSARDDEDDVFLALKSGASGYLLKASCIDELRTVIPALAYGAGVFLSAPVAQRLLDKVGEDRLRTTRPELSKREVEVLGLVAQGDTNDQIADRLCLSSHTVKRHVANILAKLHERTRADAVMHATQAGVLSLA